MGRFRVIKNSFLGGQISRTSVGRTDLPQYPHSCEILQNMIPLLSGGAYRRPGTLFHQQIPAYNSSSATTADRPPRLIPFIVSRNEAYALMLGVTGSGPTGYVKAYRATGNASAQFQANTATGSTPYLPNTGTPNSLGNFDDDVWAVQYAQSNDVMWLTHPAYKPQVIKRTALDTFTVGDFDAGLSGLQLAQAYPYLNQNATTATMKFSATSGSGTLTCSTAYFNNLQIGAIFAINSGTVLASGGIIFVKVTATSGTVGSPATTATATVIANVGSGFSTSSTYTAWWESAWSNYRGWPRTVCLFQQRLCMGGAIPTIGEAVDPLGIPAGQPDSIWFTETGDYTPKFSALGDSGSNIKAGITGTLANGQNYTSVGDYIQYPVDDSQGDGQSTGPLGILPFRVTLADSQLDSIQWMSPDQQILIGTLNEEWIVAPVNGSFDVANSLATIQSHYGSDFVPAVRIGYELMFAMKSQVEVRAYQYNYFDQSFFGEPVQLFFDEYPQAENGSPFSLGRRKFRQMDWDVTRNTLWCTDTAGNFFGMTRDRKLQVTMWHTHQFGGFNAAQGIGTGVGSNADPAWFMCDGSVISFASVPNPVAGYNDLWFVIKRTISGIVQWQVERMVGANTVRTSAYSSVAPSQGTEPYLVDCATVFTAVDWDGTDNNYSVGAQANGQTLIGTYYSKSYGLFAIGTTGTVAAGVATLNASNLPPDYTISGYVFTLGLPYTPIIQPVRIDPQGQIGTTQGAIKRISKAYAWLYKTLTLNCGSPPNGQTESAPTPVPFAASATPGQSPEIYTGTKQIFVPQQFDRDSYIYLTQTQPFPLFIAAIITEGAEYEQ